jgi:hypothetical protein
VGLATGAGVGKAPDCPDDPARDPDELDLPPHASPNTQLNCAQQPPARTHLLNADGGILHVDGSAADAGG